MLALAGALLALALPTAASATTVVNGDFESGTLAGWTQFNEGSSGSWFAYSGTTNPFGPEPELPPPPQGNFAAITAQSDPGTHILYQDVALEPGFSHVLTLTAYYHSSAPIAVPTPDTLSASVEPNQQYRIDVIKPTAPLTSLEPSDILATVLATQEGDPEFMAPKQIQVDLSQFGGQTVRLRMVEVDNQLFFNAGLDAVSISGPPPAPPAPSNLFTFGKLKLNKKKGTATLKVNVPGPGTLVSVDVKKKGKRVKRATATATAAGLATLKLKPTGSGKKTLEEKGKLPFNLSVTFTPTGGAAASQPFSGKLN
ncbi:MAG TPA: hypothetical protein VFX44_00090 [Solirubrobacterales bacterium]|nr:hypothetical protein [Solirubrobacterales bacterium]